jgi:hypothetical protein
MLVVHVSQVLKQRSFKDFVVDARTGMPIPMTDEQKRVFKRAKAADEVFSTIHLLKCLISRVCKSIQVVEDFCQACVVYFASGWDFCAKAKHRLLRLLCIFVYYVIGRPRSKQK